MTLPSIMKIDKAVADLLTKKKNIQEKCPHTSASKTANSNTGNWSKSDDYYWYDCYCPRCNKRWTEDQ